MKSMEYDTFYCVDILLWISKMSKKSNESLLL